ncbi:MAG: hypothetical protein GQ535_16670 [Rhodobacteraceae bacterium]|nr:hypothetical protein [Paracoccaceae bacterium]
MVQYETHTRKATILKTLQKRSNLLSYAFVLVTGLLVSISAFLLEKNWENADNERNFDSLAQNQTLAIKSRIFSTIDSLRSIRGLYNSSNFVDRNEFAVFIESLEIKEQIQALEWIPRVPHILRSEVEQMARDDGFADYSFTERLPNGELVRALDRDSYFPVFYVEPLFGNTGALGFDLASNPARKAALDEAMNTGQAVVTSRIKLVQSDGAQFGFLIFMPIFVDGAVPMMLQDRREKLVGYALGVYKMSDLVASVLSRDAEASTALDVAVFDLSAPLEEQLLFTTDDTGLTRADTVAEYSTHETFKFAGREWQISIVTAPNSSLTTASQSRWLFFGFGLFATFAGLLYLNGLFGRAIFADNQVTLKTAELVQADVVKEQILQKLKQTNQDLESFTFVASHDLKAPLRGIDNLVSWIAEDSDSSLSEDSLFNLQRLKTRVQRLENLLEGLLEYSHAGAIKAKTSHVNSYELCQSITEYLSPPRGFTITLDPNLPSFETQKTALQTVLNNLISNALKHHDLPTGEINVSVKDSGSHYVFSVADNGPGIAPEHHKKIFEIFQTLVPRSKKDTSGIGLSIVTRLVSAAGGEISIHSNPGQRGTEFRFSWCKNWPTEEPQYAT